MPSPTPPRPIAAPTLLAAVAALALAGCSSPPESPDTDAATPSSASPPTPASPSPSPIAPADGTDLAACSDGDCEVEVTGPAEFEVGPELGLDTLTVDSIADEEVAFTMTTTAGSMSFGCENADTEVCTSTLTGALGPGAPVTAQATGRPGARIMVNDFVIEVLAATAGSAVVRIEPA